MNIEPFLWRALDEVRLAWDSAPRDDRHVLLAPHPNSLRNWVAFESGQKRRRHFVYIDGESMRFALTEHCGSDVWRDHNKRYWLSAAAASACLRHCGIEVPGDNSSVRFILYDKRDNVNHSFIAIDRAYSREQRMGDAHATVRTGSPSGQNEMDDVLLLAASLARKRYAKRIGCKTCVYVVSGDDFKWLTASPEWVQRRRGVVMGDVHRNVKQLESAQHWADVHQRHGCALQSERRDQAPANILKWSLCKVLRGLPQTTPCFVGLAARAAHDTSPSSLADADDDPCYETPLQPEAHELPSTLQVEGHEISTVLSNWDDSASVSQSLTNAFDDHHIDSDRINRLAAGAWPDEAPSIRCAALTTVAFLITLTCSLSG